MSAAPDLVTPAPATLGRGVRVCAGLAGVLLVVTPPLVEFVAGDFFLLLPLALLLALIALVALIRRRSALNPLGQIGLKVAVSALVVAIASEVFEQSLTGPVPTLADLVPPLAFFLTGVGLLLTLVGPGPESP